MVAFQLVTGSGKVFLLGCCEGKGPALPCKCLIGEPCFFEGGSGQSFRPPSAGHCCFPVISFQLPASEPR